MGGKSCVHRKSICVVWELSWSIIADNDEDTVNYLCWFTDGSGILPGISLCLNKVPFGCRHQLRPAITSGGPNMSAAPNRCRSVYHQMLLGDQYLVISSKRPVVRGRQYAEEGFIPIWNERYFHLLVKMVFRFIFRVSLIVWIIAHKLRAGQYKKIAFIFHHADVSAPLPVQWNICGMSRTLFQKW